MKLLITGAGGMLGSAVVPVMRAEGHEVFATTLRPRNGLESLDVRDYGQVVAWAEKIRPDFILHLGAETSLEACEQDSHHGYLTNTVGTHNVALACRKVGAKMVYICTAGIFDGEKDSFYTEFDEPRPLSVYGQSKWEGEKIVRSLLTEYFVFRPGWMIGGGPGKDHKFVGKITQQIRDGASELFAVSDKFGTPTYTRDLARTIVAMIKTEFYGVYHSVCRGSASRYDVAREIVRILGRDDIKVTSVHSDHFAAAYPVARPKSEMLTNQMLDLRGLNLMRSWQEALAEYLADTYSDLMRKKAAQPQAKKPRIIILGAGVGGLGIGYKLLQKGAEVTVLEKAKEVGGLARTTKYKDYSFDFSAHRFGARNKVLIDEMKIIMGENFQKRSKRSRILMWGKWLNYPFEFGNLFLAMPKGLMVRAVIDYLLATIKRKFAPTPILSFKDWFISNFGYTLYTTNCLPYASKHWRVDPSEISSEWGDARSPGAFNLKTILKDILFKRQAVDLDEDNPYPDADAFYYPKHGGVGAIPNRLADEIRNRGGDILLDVAVSGVNILPNGVAVRYMHEGTEKVVEGDYVVSTIPLNLLVKMLTPEVPREIHDRLSRLKYLNTIFVDVIINKSKISDDSWLYFPQPSEEIIFNRAVEFKNWSPAMATPDKTSLCLDISCMAGEPIWSEDDKLIVERARQGLLRAGIISSPEEMEEGIVIRVPYTYPIYDLSYSENLKPVVDHFEDSKRLRLLGRTGKFRYYNMDDVIWSGFELAEEIMNHAAAQTI